MKRRDKYAPGSLQAILVKREYGSLNDAKFWVRRHHYSPIKPVHITDRYYRFRLREPKSSYDYRMVDLAKKVRAVQII